MGIQKNRDAFVILPVFAVSAQRLAVQRRARRTSGSLMLHQCPCGGVVRCNGLLNEAAGAAASDLEHRRAR